MKIHDALFLSFRSACSYPLESLLQILASALGVALCVASLSLMRLYQKDLADAAEDIRYRQITLAPQARAARFDAYFAGREKGGALPVDSAVRTVSAGTARRLTLSPSLLFRVKKECPAIQFAYAVVDGTMWSHSRNYDTGSDVSVFFFGFGVTADFFPAHGLELQEGSLFSEADYQSGGQVAIMGAEMAKRIFPTTSAIGKPFFGMVMESGPIIIGVLKPHPERFARKGSGGSIDNQIFLPLPSAAYGSAQILFTVPQVSLLDAGISQLQAFLALAPETSSVRVESEREWVKKEQRMAGPLFSALDFLTGALLFGMAANTLSLLVGRIARRNRSIGLALAIGAQRHDLFLQHVVESALTGLVGGALGIPGAIGLTRLIQGIINPDGTALPGLRLTPHPVVMLAVFSLMLIINLSLSVLPAMQAARAKAADAMKTE